MARSSSKGGDDTAAEIKRFEDMMNKYELEKAKHIKKLIEEKLNNEKLFKRALGIPILYGEEIQLIHYDSGNYLKTEKTCAEVDKSSNLCMLTSKGSKDCAFLI